MRTVVIEEFPNYSISENEDIYNIKSGRKLKPVKQNNGYVYIVLSKGGNNVKCLLLHRLLMKTFVPNPNNYPCVNHIDGDKTNNRLDNLEWCTHAQNIQHAFRTGLSRNDTIRRKGTGKLIVNTETGVFYIGVYDAVISLPYVISITHLRNMLLGIIKNKTSLKYA